MADNKKHPVKTRTSRKRRPASSPEEREKQMIAMAMDLAEEQLRNGTASTQVITHFLKLGSSREDLEQDMLKKKTKLVGAQTESLESMQRVEELYSNAIKAMRRYSGGADDDDL